MRPINEIYNEKMQFVSDLNKTMTIDGNIRSLRYARDYTSGNEVMMITDSALTPFFINVTGNSLETILSEANRFQLGLKPVGLVESREARKEYAKMFEGVS